MTPGQAVTRLPGGEFCRQSGCTGKRSWAPSEATPLDIRACPLCALSRLESPCVCLDLWLQNGGLVRGRCWRFGETGF